MHPETTQLAAYLDGALPPAQRAAVRGHVLGCAACAARLALLRADSRRIAALAEAGPVPDIRAGVRRRLRRSTPLARLGHGLGLAGAVAALLVLATLASVSGGALRRAPDQLFVADYRGGKLVALDATTGAELASVAVGANPTRVRYDARAQRIYVLATAGVVAVDPRSLAVVGRWRAPQPTSANNDLALDAARGRLYVSLPGAIAVVDAATLTTLATLGAGPAPGQLALLPDDRALFALDVQEATLWTFDLARQTATAQLLDRADVGRPGWLALGSDGKTLTVLRAGTPPALWMVDAATGKAGAPTALPEGAPPQALLALAGGRVAVARGDGRRGGVAIIAAGGAQLAQLDADYDQHRLAAGAGDALFALNWLHGTVTRYDLRRNARAWQAQLPAQQPWDAAFVEGGWRF